MSDGVRCMWMRGGTSKGGYFLAGDLPADVAERDALLLRVMGSPDPRQIDGMGGADPLTSKVAIVERSRRPGVDVDYLFLQVFVDEPRVSAAQSCGNLLAGVGPFAVERGLVRAQDGETAVRIFLQNTGQLASARVNTRGGRVRYAGDARLDGVPGSASAIPMQFADTAGASCGALLPTGRPCDVIDGLEVTCIDNGMPVVIVRAADVGITGTETRAALDADSALRERLQSLRCAAGPRMNLGDVTQQTVPKVTLVSAAEHGGVISTRTFTAPRFHASIGVLGAVSVATACVLPAGPAAELARVPAGRSKRMPIEHPLGESTILVELDGSGGVARAEVLLTARKLFDGLVFAGRDD